MIVIDEDRFKMKAENIVSQEKTIEAGKKKSGVREKELNNPSNELEKLEERDIVKYRTETSNTKNYWENKGIVTKVTDHDKIFIHQLIGEGDKLNKEWKQIEQGKM